MCGSQVRRQESVVCGYSRSLEAELLEGGRALQPWWESNFWAGMIGAGVGGLLAAFVQWSSLAIEQANRFRLARHQLMNRIMHQLQYLVYARDQAFADSEMLEHMLEPVHQGTRESLALSEWLAALGDFELSMSVLKWFAGTEAVVIAMRRALTETKGLPDSVDPLGLERDRAFSLTSENLHMLTRDGSRLHLRIYCAGRIRLPKVIRRRLYGWALPVPRYPAHLIDMAE